MNFKTLIIPFLCFVCTHVSTACKTFDLTSNDSNLDEPSTDISDPSFGLHDDERKIDSDECSVLVRINDYNDTQNCLLDRNELKEANHLRNIDFFSKLKLADYSSYYCSLYAPYIEIKYASKQLFAKNDLKKIINACKNNESQYEIVDGKMYENEDEDYELIKPDNQSFYPFERALADVGISYSDNDTSRNMGNGVKIGILENYLPNSYQNFSGVSYSTFGSGSDDHPTQVASIAGGNFGIASKSSFYFVAKQSCSSKFQSVDLMILNGVNVINHSGGFSPNPHAYNIYASYIDYIVRNTGCIFVNAAGNYTSSDGYYFPNPSYGLNVISVGSCNRTLHPSFFNCKKIDSDSEYDSIIKKPNLFAPGDHLFGVRNICDGADSDDCLSGTSYAAPIVTGIVALLMGEYPELKTNPAKLISILTTSCNKMANQESDFDNTHGFGVINYENARLAYQNSSSVNSSNLSGDIFQGSLSLFGGEDLTISSESLYNASNNTSGSTIISSSSIQYVVPRISLYDQSNNIVATSNLYGNFCYLSFKNDTNSTINLHYSICAENYMDFVGVSQMIGYSLVAGKDKLNTSLSIINNYLDTNPTFNWNVSSLKIINHIDMYVTNFRGQEIFRSLNVSGGFSVTLTTSVWGNIIDMRGREYYAFIKIVFNDNFSAYSKVSFLLEPNRYRDLIQILPIDYEFEEQYFFYEKTTTFSFDNVNITTKRLRCGYIQNQYIVLSPKRTGAGSAYLQMDFDSSIYSVLIGLAWWSNNERVYSSNGDSYVLEYKNNSGQWVEWLDLLNDVSITTNRDIVDRFIISDSGGINGIRIVCYCASPTSDRNKGRICVDDIVLNQNYSFNFISQFYDPVY